jgi:general stress protein 26
MKDDMSARVKEALERTEIMALSTSSEDGSWVSPVRFEYNDKLELTFMSMPKTKHVQNILKDPRVSVAIYSFPGPEGGNLGLQIQGMAEDLTGSDASGWHSFKITPSQAWLFDSRVSRERQQVDLASLHL